MSMGDCLAALALNEFRACLYNLRLDYKIGKHLHSWLACAEPAKNVFASTPHTINKIDNRCCNLVYGVVKLSSLELYKTIISTIKEDTQVYYNMRMSLGLECA